MTVDWDVEMPAKTQYFTVQEVADQLRVTRQAVYNWIDEGKLKAVKVGRSVRVADSALADFLKPAERGDRDERQP